MNEAFLKLEEEKQQMILNTCFKIFSEHGYKRTSTNEIIAAAGISKGMLFYYFKSKKELFHTLIQLSMDFSEEKFYEQEISDPDFITRISKYTKQKAELMQHYPDMTRFLTRVFTQEIDLLNEKEIYRYEKIKTEAFSSIYKGIDFSLFRDDIDRQTVMMMIQDSIVGYEQRLMPQITDEMIQNNDYSVLFDEFEAYIENLRKVYYKGV
ncbi:TetR/AcrR family transcriptional regulator [Macrococcus capreoli]|uniref:TetR/AcrR family transcriptional regulator n=1 Tax=Macrococcus capreoli TaxID=2982690 RepID=UPI0021D5FB89|nr:TetR/AcrR family transcriptional regulator [Macrococcus sp. TMW 2.2395]MCU7557081.1 TetR/AcrR family transcriptional regulator [Macrococcus sp. TMW 2.2395]